MRNFFLKKKASIKNQNYHFKIKISYYANYKK